MLFLNRALKQLIKLQINQTAQVEQSLFLQQAQCSQTQEPVKRRKKQRLTQTTGKTYGRFHGKRSVMAFTSICCAL